MPELTYARAISRAMREEMHRDDRVILMGEDMRSPLWAGAGLVEEFGTERVLDAPISEAAFLGAAFGAAAMGLRPIVDMTIATLLYCGCDQIVNNAAKMRYMSGGQIEMPVVVRARMTYGVGGGAQHADRPYPMFMTVPGLLICVPSNPYDALGLLKSAIRDNNPVLFFEDGTCSAIRGEVPDEEILVPFGKARTIYPGTDLTIVAIAGAVPHAMAAAKELMQNHGVSAGVIDPRTLVPLDAETILTAARSTGRLLIADPAPRTCSAASEIAALAAGEILLDLRAPIARVTAPDLPVPFASHLERELYPTSGRIVEAALQMIRV
jgi:pyruvate dehydrogenase E1 component beta subunit